MQGKISVFAFLVAIVAVMVRLLMENADKEGNVYIKTPKQYFREIKSGFAKFKQYFKNRL